MDKFLTSTQTLLPLVAFYPRWVQLLFLGTFSLFLLSVLMFVVLYSQAADQKKASDASREIAPAVRQKIAADVDATAATAAELGLALSNYHASAMALRLHLQNHTLAKPNVVGYAAAALPAPLKQDAEDVVRKLEALQGALAAIQRNEFTAACWRRAAAAPDVAFVKRIRDALRSEGFSESETMVDVADLPNLTQFIAIAAARLRQSTFAPLLSAALSTNAADIAKVGQGYDNVMLRSLVYAGNLLFSSTQPARGRPQDTLVVSWGSAMLLDLYKAIPSGEVVREELRARLPKQQAAIDALDIRVSPDRLLGSDFRAAVAELEKRPALLVLRIPK